MRERAGSQERSPVWAAHSACQRRYATRSSLLCFEAACSLGSGSFLRSREAGCPFQLAAACLGQRSNWETLVDAEVLECRCGRARGNLAGHEEDAVCAGWREMHGRDFCSLARWNGHAETSSIITIQRSPPLWGGNIRSSPLHRYAVAQARTQAC